MKKTNKLSNLLNTKTFNIAASFTDDIDPEHIEEAFDKGLDIAELRIDLFEDDSPDNIADVATLFVEKPTIATIRSTKEGGEWSGRADERLELYKIAIENWVDAVDVELISDEILDDLFVITEENNVSLIISHHNFNETPDAEFLEDIILKAHTKGADIIKIATQINAEKDIEILEKLLANNPDKNLVIIGMGELGVKTRIEFPKKGSKLTFCSFQQSTARGQITLKEMVGFKVNI